MTELPREYDHRSISLEPIAMVALDAGRMAMEAGASGRSVEKIVETVARGLGATRVDLRIGYASLDITVGVGESGITRMRKVGRIGVNQRFDHQLWDLAGRVSRQKLTPEQTRDGLACLATDTPHHAPWLVALAVGLACVAFSRLLGADWYGALPVFIASTLGQYLRDKLLHRHTNVFIATTFVAFVSSVIAGSGAQWAGSETSPLAMVASILMLVPGVPALNAQSDILEGLPTLGSARVVTVVMTLVFMAAGLWAGEAILSYLQWIRT